MNAPTTLALFGAGLGVVFAAAFGVGSAVGPVGAAAAPHEEHAVDEQHVDEQPADEQPADEHRVDEHGTDHADPDGAAPAGLAVSEDGHTLLLDEAPRAAARPARLSFRVLGPDGAPVTRYAVEHEKELHLVLVRRDGTGFQHLHPTRDAAGRWTTPVTLPTAGTWKAFADFTPAGAESGVVLATDVTVPGVVPPPAAVPLQRTAVVDGYTVTLTGDLVPGTDSPLTLTVSKGGRPLDDLQPYLGAYGHLVALREGDLAYLHVHPQDGAAGPQVSFVAEVPTAGDYRLFLDFSHDDVVRTAAFRLRALPEEDR